MVHQPQHHHPKLRLLRLQLSNPRQCRQKHHRLHLNQSQPLHRLLRAISLALKLQSYFKRRTSLILRMGNLLFAINHLPGDSMALRYPAPLFTLPPGVAGLLRKGGRFGADTWPICSGIRNPYLNSYLFTLCQVYKLLFNKCCPRGVLRFFGGY